MYTNWGHLTTITYLIGPGPRFSKAPETFRARKTIFSSSVSTNGVVYTPETSCMKGTSVHIKNTWIKQLCNRKVRDFAMAFRARKVSGAFEKRAPGVCFSKGPETFRACKAIFGWSFSKTRELCTPETSWMKRTSVHLKNMWITQLCNHNVRDFATAFRVPKLFGTFE